MKYFKISWGRTPRPPKTYCLLPKHAYYTKSSRYAPDNLTCFLNQHYIVQFKSKFVLFGLVHILNIGTLPKRTLATGLPYHDYFVHNTLHMLIFAEGGKPAKLKNPCGMRKNNTSNRLNSHMISHEQVETKLDQDSNPDHSN